MFLWLSRSRRITHSATPWLPAYRGHSWAKTPALLSGLARRGSSNLQAADRRTPNPLSVFSPPTPRGASRHPSHLAEARGPASARGHLPIRPPLLGEWPQTLLLPPRHRVESPSACVFAIVFP